MLCGVNIFLVGQSKESVSGKKKNEAVEGEASVQRNLGALEEGKSHLAITLKIFLFFSADPKPTSWRASAKDLPGRSREIFQNVPYLGKATFCTLDKFIPSQCLLERQNPCCISFISFHVCQIPLMKPRKSSDHAGWQIIARGYSDIPEAPLDCCFLHSVDLSKLDTRSTGQGQRPPLWLANKQPNRRADQLQELVRQTYILTVWENRQLL